MLRISLLAVAWFIAAASGTAQGQAGEALLARGKYLMDGPVACANCHNRPLHGLP